MTRRRQPGPPRRNPRSPRQKAPTWLVLLVLLAAALWWWQQRPTPGEAVITRITDGDTVHVRLDDRDTTLRVLWIDTPEKFASASLDSDVRHCAIVGPRVRQRLQAMGKQASAYARNMLHVGEHVKVERHGTDYFKRTLSLLYTQDGTPYNRAVIEAGYACIYRKAKYPPDLERLLAQAQRQRRGLWSQEPALMACLCH